MAAWLFVTLLASVLFSVLPLVNAAQPGGVQMPMSLLAAAAGVAAAATLAAGESAAAAALKSSRTKRDRDCGDAKGEKTINGYVSAFRSFYNFCRTTGRADLVPPAVAKEKLKDPDIFRNCSHALIADQEGDVFS